MDIARSDIVRSIAGRDIGKLFFDAKQLENQKSRKRASATKNDNDKIESEW